MFTLLRRLVLLFKSDLTLPTLLLISYIAFLLIIKKTIPSSEELVAIFSSLYNKFGYEIILISAFLETLVIINLFVPGQLAIALGIIFARSGGTELTLVILSALIGAVAGYMIDYFLGYLGFADILRRMGYKKLIDKTKQQVQRFGKRGMSLGFIHANIASVLSLVAGATGMKFLSFATVAIFSSVFWIMIWSMVIYIVGDIVLLIIRKYAFLLILLGILVMILARIWKSEEKEESEDVRS
ncbi:VTT domain-containing protein [Candidatus Daviesbacteria bacterium]|nr:VTT domain-containing protein [Candidatus Daviesbacteria bacterium]